MKTPLKALGAGAAIGVAGSVAGSAALARLRPATDGLAELTKEELYERAKAADIPGRSEMNKDELIRALRSG